MENCMKFNRTCHINDFYIQDTICDSSFSKKNLQGTPTCSRVIGITPGRIVTFFATVLRELATPPTPE
jgi:hypothetical protein